jgi:hypothetical protein
LITGKKISPFYVKIIGTLDEKNPSGVCPVFVSDVVYCTVRGADSTGPAQFSSLLCSLSS